MPNWTPGPWKWEVVCNVARLRSEAAISRASCPDFDGLDPVCDDGSAGGEYKPTITPDSANAHLIAAAPELYEALEQAVRNVAPQPLCGQLVTSTSMLHCQRPAGHQGDHFGTSSGEWLFAATKALAKARGEE